MLIKSMDALLAHCSNVADVSHFFISLTIRTPIEFANRYDSEEEVLSASRQVLGNANLSTISQLVSLWELANHWADDAAEQTARCYSEPLCRQDQRVSVPSSQIGQFGKTLSVLPRQKFRRRRFVAEPITAPSDASKYAQPRADQLWLLFLQINDAGSLWNQYCTLSGPLQEAFGQSKIESWLACPTSTLSRAVNTASRWAAWCEQNGVSPWMPSALEVGLWLRSLRAKGPTAARGAFAALKWLQRHVGAPFHTASEEVASYGVDAPEHEEIPASPMSVALWVLLEQVLGSANAGDPFKLLSACWIFLLVGCVRFKHLQQSRLIECYADGLEFLCAKGKARVRGAQRPFRWRMPRFGITGIDLFKVWSKLLRTAFEDLKGVGFVLPDFRPKRVPLERVTGLAEGPMPRWKFTRLSTAMFKQLGVTYVHRGKPSALTYASRRVLPTLADIAGFRPREMLAIGAWMDSKRPSLQEMSWRLAMPLRYSDNKLALSQRLKSELIGAARLAWSRWCCQKESRDPSWEDLIPLWPRRAEVSSAVPAALPGKQTEGSSSPLLSEPSISDAEDDRDEPTWLLPASSKRSKLHLQSAVTPGTTQCGKKLRRPEEGAGLEKALATGREWSPTCFRKLPESSQERWLGFSKLHT